MNVLQTIMAANTCPERRVSILVLGKTGSGKSTLINAMLKGEVARTSSSPTPTEHNSVESHEGNLDDYTVIMYDTKGFFDREENEDNILNGISQECTEGFSLILICLKMIDKVDRSVYECLQKLQRRLDKDLWKRCVFVLTFTNFWLENNDICDLSKDQKIAALIKQINAFKKAVKECAKGIISGEIFDEIPFALAGTAKKRQLICDDGTEVRASDDAEQNILAATEDWLVELWHVCMRQCEETKKPFLKHFVKRYWPMIGLGVGASIGTTSTTVIGAAVGVVGLLGGPIIAAVTIPAGAAIGFGIGVVGTGVGTGVLITKLTTSQAEKPKPKTA